jgi:hypothetical protein
LAAVPATGPCGAIYWAVTAPSELLNVVSYDVAVSFEACMWQMLDMRIGVYIFKRILAQCRKCDDCGVGMAREMSYLTPFKEYAIKKNCTFRSVESQSLANLKKKGCINSTKSALRSAIVADIEQCARMPGEHKRY